MEYLEIKFTLPQKFRDIIVAELSETGFDTFLETDYGFNTYTDNLHLNYDPIKAVISKYRDYCAIEFETTRFPDKNWNEEWEKKFDPIVVENKCLVRAPFHDIAEKYPLEVLIQPKMAFGTGHHATTYLMLQEIIKLNLEGNSVLDIGSGTGILAIAAIKLGASNVWATDINEWSISNSQDNFNLNGISSIRLCCGQITELEIPHQFDLILANINRNVLLEEIPYYVPKLNTSGYLIVSGFFKADQHLIEACLTDNGMQAILQHERDQWSVLVCKIM